MEKPFSCASERNKRPILEAIRELINEEDQTLLEIGSGSGQHGIYLSEFFPHLVWTFSDRTPNHPGIKSWMHESNKKNLAGPLSYEVGSDPFPHGRFDLIFTANTFHIMSWKLVKTLIKSLGKSIHEGGRVFIYGPFNYKGEYTSQSNRTFDQWLKDQDSLSGIRNFEDVLSQMERQGFRLLKDFEMPANNRLLAFIKI